MYFLLVGGGSLRWIVKKHLHVDGLISAQGGKQPYYSPGAGSGGSILLELTNLTGEYLNCNSFA